MQNLLSALTAARLRILGAAGAAALAAVIWKHEADALRGANLSYTRIVVAKTNLEKGTRLSLDNLRQDEVRTAYAQLHPDSVKGNELEGVLDRQLEVPVQSGQALLWRDLPGTSGSEATPASGQLPRGMRGVALSISEALSRLGRPLPRERIDILLTTSPGAESRGSMTLTLLQDIQVLERKDATVLLSLRPDDAELLTFASTHGGVTVVLRNAEEGSVRLPAKTLQSVLEQVPEPDTRQPARSRELRTELPSPATAGRAQPSKR